ncbi:MAG TPA: hypothetical protein VMM27_03165 [Casimicrobiaceae bacterium]|nr:hypothetical protein [Casimicrobiaceae bacterium]
MKARTIRRTTLMLMLASLPCFVTAAGSRDGDDVRPVAWDQATSRDDHFLGAGGSFYAPGSYSSWFYVSPPADDPTPAAPEPLTSSPARAALDLPAYYDYEPRWGPLVA